MRGRESGRGWKDEEVEMSTSTLVDNAYAHTTQRSEGEFSRVAQVQVQGEGEAR